MSYYAPPPAPPPAICSGTEWVDVVGTPGPDRLRAFSRATRVWGLGGADALLGSYTRASCLIGGRGNDFLALNAGGGVAFGQAGSDVLVGSYFGDILDGGRGLDAITALGGDDKIASRDGNPEVVWCGDGDDIVKGDRVDVLIGCESADLTGPPAPRLKARPAVAGRHRVVRARFEAPRAGRYQVLYVTTADGRRCAGGPAVLADPGRLRRRQRVTLKLRPPKGGWCRGSAKAAVIRYPSGEPPAAGVARLSFSVR